VEVSQDRPVRWSATRLALFLVILFGVLYVAADLFIPIAVALLFTLLLSPLVRRLSRIGLPRAVAAALVVVLALGAVGSGLWGLSGPAMEWVEEAPRNMREMRDKLWSIRRALEDVKEATEEVEEAAEEAAGGDGPKPTEVVVRRPGFPLAFATGTGELLATVLVTSVLLYFILASGDLFLRKALKVTSGVGHRRRTVEIFRRAERDISAYLVTITLINGALGVATGAAMWALGMPNPVLWGAMAGVLNFVPFVGAAVTLGVIAIVALMSFDTLTAALAPPLVFLAFTALEGHLITPALVGRRLTLNPVAVFLALMVWGWMWGIAGILLAVPLLTAVKIVCDNVPALTPVAQILDRR